MTSNGPSTHINCKTVPLISVALPVYNGEQYLVEAIESILAQTFADFELIIIDDGSTDNSLAILKHYQLKDLRIRLVEQENQNLASTLNNILDLAQGQWVARMDQDDIALPHRFERQLQWLEQTGADICGSWVKFFGSWDRRTFKPYESDQAIKMDMLFKSPFAHPSVMMRTDFAKQLRYDKCCEKAEDYDLWVRAAQAGWKMTNVPEVLLLYRKHGSQITTATVVKLQKVSKLIQTRYWSLIADTYGFNPDSAREIVNLFYAVEPSDMDVVDKTLNILLQDNQGEAKQGLINNISRLYLKTAAEHPKMSTRWEKLDCQLSFGLNLFMRFKFFIISSLNIRYGSSLYTTIRKIYNYTLR